MNNIVEKVFCALIILSNISLYSMEQPLLDNVIVRSTDGQNYSMPLVVIKDSAYLYGEYAYKLSRKCKNISLNAPVSSKDLSLFSSAINALESGDKCFNDFYQLLGDGELHSLINLTQPLESSQLIVQLAQRYFPLDIVKAISSYVVGGLVSDIRYKMIRNNCCLYQENKEIKWAEDSSLAQKVLVHNNDVHNLSYDSQTFLNCEKSISIKLNNDRKNIIIKNLKKKDSLSSVLVHDYPIGEFVLSHNNQMLITCSHNGHHKSWIRLWDIAQLGHQGVQQLKTIVVYGEVIASQLNPMDDRFIVALDSGAFLLFSIPSSFILLDKLYSSKRNQKKHYDPKISFSADGRLALIMDLGKHYSCKLWDVYTRECVLSFNNIFFPSLTGALTCDDQVVIVPYKTEYKLLTAQYIALLNDNNKAVLDCIANKKECRESLLEAYKLWRWYKDVIGDNELNEESLNALITSKVLCQERKNHF